MTTRDPSDRWISVVHKTICSNIRNKLASAIPKSSTFKHLHWRLAYNLFRSKQFYESLKILENYFEIVQGTRKVLNSNSDLHLTAARCCFQLYLLTKLHYNLNKSFRHYEDCISTLKADFCAVIKLPKILLELAMVFECYGAFDSAMTIYRKILEDFPNTTAIFLTYYRSAQLGLFLAAHSLLYDESEKETTIETCVDIFSFLINDCPMCINQVDLVIGNIRCLELSNNGNLNLRVKRFYRSLFEHCSAMDPPLLGAERYISEEAWAADAETAFAMGEYVSEREPLLASDLYEVYMFKMKLNRAAIAPDALVQIAQNYARFQSFGDAIPLLERVLEVDYLHKECRRCLSLWSSIYDARLGVEEKCVNMIKRSFRERIFTESIRRKLKNETVTELEEKVARNHFDVDTRSKLSYLSKFKWRAAFLLEDTCAKRIQAAFRQRRILFRWESAIKNLSVSRANELCIQYFADPFSRVVRASIVKFTKSVQCPKKHKIVDIAQRFHIQSHAVYSMSRAFLAHRFRAHIHFLVSCRERLWREKLRRAASLIQAATRRKLAYNLHRAYRRYWFTVITAAKRIQRWYRAYVRSVKFAANQLLDELKRKRRHARRTLRYVLLYHYRQAVRRRQLILLEEQRRQRCHESEIMLRLIEEAARMIQKQMRQVIRRRTSQLASKALASRRAAACVGENVVGKECQRSIKCYRIIRDVFADRNHRYEIPGIRKNSVEFLRVLAKTSVYCKGGEENNGSSFSSFDCIMLSRVLKDPRCCIQAIVLEELALCEEDDVKELEYVRSISGPHTDPTTAPGTAVSSELQLLDALSSSRSLHTVVVSGGHYSSSFIASLCSHVQVNPSIKQLCIENVHGVSTNSAAVLSISDAAGRLMCDFFNYTLPGLQSLCLHRCSIRDENLELICQGLKVNSTLSSLTLSHNVITDAGFGSIITSVLQNNAGVITHLDFSHNLITLPIGHRTMLDNYIHRPEKGSLEIHLHHNIIAQPYVCPSHRLNRIELVVYISDINLASIDPSLSEPLPFSNLAKVSRLKRSTIQIL